VITVVIDSDTKTVTDTSWKNITAQQTVLTMLLIWEFTKIILDNYNTAETRLAVHV